MSDAPARFWDWAVRVYADPAVSGACLELQDAHGQCVPLLLWAVWLGGEGIALTAEPAARAVAVARAWHEEVLVPIRAVRRRMKSPIAGMADEARLRMRERIKALELDGERELMATLAVLVCSGAQGSNATRVKTAVEQHAENNLVAIASRWTDAVPQESLRGLVGAINHAGPAADGGSVAR